MQFYLKILFTLSSLSSVLSYGKAQDRLLYGSECLRDIAQSIERSDTSPREGLQLVGRESDIPIKVEQGRDGVVVHLGVDIFGDEIKAEYGALLFNFVERYLLELLLKVNDLDVSERNEIEDIEIGGDLGAIPLFTSSNLSEISLEVVSDGSRYDISWSDANDSFAISFPASYSLLVGKSKIELEDDLYGELQNYSGSHAPSLRERVNDSKLRKIADNLYEYDQGYYMIPSMRNIQYLELVEGSYNYIYSAERPCETLTNLATQYSGSNHPIVLHVEQQKYGSINNEFHYRLNDLVAFCLDEGCTPYISFEQGEPEEGVSATIFMVNYDCRYNHMLQLEFENFDSLEVNSVISCEINTYIPTHNTSELYDEANQVNSRHNIKL